jgi:methyltransferase-like protein
MNLELLKNKLKNYSKKDIIFTKHAELQAFVREVILDEVKENIINPIRLVYFEKQEAENDNEEKYDCYFAYSKHLYHRYALIFNGKVLIVTIIKINRDWQKAIG